MSIDVHCHYLPESAQQAYRSSTPWYGTTFDRDDDGILIATTGDRRFKFGSPQYLEPIEQRVQRMDDAGVDVEMLSLLPPLFRYELPPHLAVSAARDLNDELADLASRFPGRFAGLGTLPLQDVPASVRELERVHEIGGLAGVTIGTHVEGRNLDEEDLAPVWEAANELNAFVFIHPVQPRAAAALGRYYLRNVIGNPLETTIAASSLMLSGRLSRSPDVNICLAHAGGYLAWAHGRLDWSQSVRPEAGPAGGRPRDLLKRFYYDCLSHDEPTLRHLADLVGSDRVVAGTDFPADMGRPDLFDEMRGWSSFTGAERRAIRHDNLAPFVERALVHLPRRASRPERAD